jgi:endonuclease/exonuclease/phosphatase family metal-dependent hydrolase
VTLTVASWNVLADDYVRPEYYPFSPAELLAPGQRHAGVIERLRASSADIICLQEVDAGLLARLDGQGFTVCKTQKRGKPDWLVTLVRGAVGSCTTRPFSDGTGHVALTVEAHGVLVTNTHLKWDGTGDFAARQVVELLPPPEGAWILCGDLNADPESPALKQLLGAGLCDAYAVHPKMFTSNANRRAKRIDFLLHTPALRAEPVPLRAVTDETPLPAHDEPSDHLMISARFTPASASAVRT